MNGSLLIHLRSASWHLLFSDILNSFPTHLSSFFFLILIPRLAPESLIACRFFFRLGLAPVDPRPRQMNPLRNPVYCPKEIIMTTEKIGKAICPLDGRLKYLYCLMKMAEYIRKEQPTSYCYVMEKKRLDKW